MALSRPQLAYLYYLEISLTVSQNYRITAFLNLRLTPLKCQKVKKQQQQNRKNKSLKNHHRYIYWVSHWLDKIKAPRPFGPQR